MEQTTTCLYERRFSLFSGHCGLNWMFWAQEEGSLGLTQKEGKENGSEMEFDSNEFVCMLML